MFVAKTNGSNIIPVEGNVHIAEPMLMPMHLCSIGETNCAMSIVLCIENARKKPHQINQTALNHN